MKWSNFKEIVQIAALLILAISSVALYLSIRRDYYYEEIYNITLEPENVWTISKTPEQEPIVIYVYGYAGDAENMATMPYRMWVLTEDGVHEELDENGNPKIYYPDIDGWKWLP